MVAPSFVVSCHSPSINPVPFLHQITNPSHRLYLILLPFQPRVVHLLLSGTAYHLCPLCHHSWQGVTSYISSSYSLLLTMVFKVMSVVFYLFSSAAPQDHRGWYTAAIIISQTLTVVTLSAKATCCPSSSNTEHCPHSFRMDDCCRVVLFPKTYYSSCSISYFHDECYFPSLTADEV